MSEIARLDKKAKAGWRAFFIMRENYFNLIDEYNMLRNHHKLITDRIKRNDLEVDLEYLKKQFIDMYDTIKNYQDCPICFETLTKENMEVLNCGHLCCKLCKEKLKTHNGSKCSICRKSIF